jgi:dTDP-4-amino-4,6-dideoxygalactose transaminase
MNPGCYASEMIRETERHLAGRFGRKRAFLAGRGATGLILLYEALSKPGGRILLPSIACQSLPATVLLTGRRPVAIDVDGNLNIDPEKLEREIRPGDLVVGIHLFGIPFAVREIERICEKHGATLIEDVAQGPGGMAENRVLGSFGRASILSFAKGKTLPTGGGGAILTDDEALIESLEEKIKELPKRSDDCADKSRELRDKLTPAFNEARRGNVPAIAASLWGEIIDNYSGIFRYSIEPDEASEIIPALDDLPRNAERRRKMVSLYRKYLSGAQVRFLDYRSDQVPWRFTVVASTLSGGMVHECTEALRSDGLDVSNLYLPVQWLAPGRIEDTGCPEAEAAGVRVINLWVDDSVDEEKIEKAAGTIRKFTG